jgi:hypothetical protein
MARSVAEEEKLGSHQCCFFEMDATIDPDMLLAG